MACTKISMAEAEALEKRRPAKVIEMPRPVGKAKRNLGRRFGLRASTGEDKMKRVYAACKGKTVDHVWVTSDGPNMHTLSSAFTDETEMTFSLTPSVMIEPELLDVRNGDCKMIRRYRDGSTPWGLRKRLDPHLRFF
jgi:hypothetical protein